MRIESIDSFEDLSCHADAWNRLALDSPQRIPATSHAWIVSYLENFLRPDERWVCFLATGERGLVGVLPVIIGPHPVFGRARPRLRLPHNDHCLSVDILAARGLEREIIRQLLAAAQSVIPRAQDLALARVPETSPTIAALRGRMREGIALTEPGGFGSVLAIEGSFGDYRQSLSHNFRRNLTKARNKFLRRGGYEFEFLTGRNGGEHEFEEFIKIETMGWKARAGTAIAQSPRLTAYYGALARRLHDLGWLEWHFLRAGDRLIAGQMAARMGRSLTVLKIAYDEDHAELSPGNLLFERTIERAFAAGDTDEIDCVTDMPWHRNWAMRKRRYFNLWIYPRRPLPWMIGATGRRARMGIRRIPGMTPFYRMLKQLVGGPADK